MLLLKSSSKRIEMFTVFVMNFQNEIYSTLSLVRCVRACIFDASIALKIKIIFSVKYKVKTDAPFRRERKYYIIISRFLDSRSV